jgi:hypothetical protein
MEKCYQHFDPYSATTSRRSLDEGRGTVNRRPAMEFKMRSGMPIQVADLRQRSLRGFLLFLEHHVTVWIYRFAQQIDSKATSGGGPE